jgi:N-acyl-D-amino-acid deacylase
VTWGGLSSGRRDPTCAEVLARVRELGGETYPQTPCRPIVSRISLHNPVLVFFMIPAFTETYALPPERRHELYADPAWRARAKEQIAADPPMWNDKWTRITVAETTAHPELVDGPTLAKLASDRGVDALDLMCDLALDDDLATRFLVIQSNYDEPELQWLVGPSTGVLVSLSDAGAHSDQLCDAVWATHLLGHWVREVGALTLEQGVWRITGHPAQVYRLEGRGRIAPGYAADLVAFDPDTVGYERAERVHDLPAGADRLVAGSRGIHATWVNGALASQNGNDLTATRNGRVLR